MRHLLPLTALLALGCGPRDKVVEPAIEAAANAPAKVPGLPFNCSPNPPQGDEPLLVDHVAQLQDERGCIAFNNGRPYVVSSHTQLGDSYMDELVSSMTSSGFGGSVVLGWFEKRPVERLDVEIGDEVPREMAVAVLTTVRAHSDKPLVVYKNKYDEGFRDNWRVFVGSMRMSENEITDDAQLDKLLDPALPEAEFWEMLPERVERVAP